LEEFMLLDNRWRSPLILRHRNCLANAIGASVTVVWVR
jgi:hypothetical protein